MCVCVCVCVCLCVCVCVICLRMVSRKLFLNEFELICLLL